MFSGRIALAGGGAFQRGEQLRAQQRKIALDPAFAPDQYMIGCGQTVPGKEIAQEFPEPAFHPVANHRVADSLGNSDAKAHLLDRIGASKQHKAGARYPQAPVGS